MTLNEVLIRQNFINKLLIKNENVDVDKNLKVKIIMMRAELNKYKTQFDNDCLNKISELKTDEFIELDSLKELSDEQTIRIKELREQLTKEYNDFLIEKGKVEVDFNKKFTEDEYTQIVDVNSNNNVDVNGTPLDSLSFLEIIYTLFVK